MKKRRTLHGTLKELYDAVNALDFSFERVQDERETAMLNDAMEHASVFLARLHRTEHKRRKKGRSK
jgi:hypothetical protein